jgi:PAS domain S-box-containing protein
MKILFHIPNKIKGVSLKWKLLIPFLLFALAGTFFLTYVGLTSQQKLIRDEEEKGLMESYHRLLEEVDQKKNQAEALASVIAENPHVQDALSERDRKALADLLMPTYVQLKMDYNIEQLHFHLPGAVSFLRLHYLERYGEDMSAYRKTIMDATASGKPKGGLELGVTGYGIRGVAPVFRYGKLVGSVEVGHSFDESFLNDLHERWGMDFILYSFEQKEKRTSGLIGKAGRGFEGFVIDEYLPEGNTEKPRLFFTAEKHQQTAILLAPLRDYSGKEIALVGIGMDRSQVLGRLSRTKFEMAMVGLGCIVISFLLTYITAYLFLRPIKRIVKEAHEIAEESRENHLDEGSGDEIGSLTRALNVMLDSLKQRRKQIERYAKMLEARVTERTADLVASEEKYRTLVENVPLIVYRVLQDGTTEFINSHMTETLGYTVEEAVRDRRFWIEKICSKNPDAGIEGCFPGFENGGDYRFERLVKDKRGRLLTFIDRAMPNKDAKGNLRWIDGIMMDITEVKELQERAIRAEEIRVLGEISAHMAHEIRNPLISAGGFARRLRDSIPISDHNHKLAQIIVDEVIKLENFLRILFSSTRPLDLIWGPVDPHDLLRSCLAGQEEFLRSRGVEVVTEFHSGFHQIPGDREKLTAAFASLLKHAIVSTPGGEPLFLSTGLLEDRFMITFKHRVSRLSEDDLDKFFFPHTEEDREAAVLDLPFARIIIHRHGGKIDLRREAENVLVMTIELPTGPLAEQEN